MAKHKVLSTKKLEPSLVEKAKENDIEIIEQEAIRVHPILTKEKWDEIFQIIESRKEYVVFTSSNAVDAVKKYLHTYINPFAVHWKILCLSGKTKEAVEESAEIIGSIEDVAENAAALAERIIAKRIKEVVFFCGNKRRDELPGLLKMAGIQVNEVVVYETTETPTVVVDNIDAVLFFSPSTVQSFFSVNQLKKHTVCFAIGQTTADCLADFTNNRSVVSGSPSQEKMLALVQSYF